ncbi:MAG TPA: hypothetical protein VI389_08015 [Geobacteraceae bacterium]
MRLHIKAALLSVVLPGLGQLHKGNRIKGVVLIILVNIFLLVGLFFVMRGMGQFILSAKMSGAADAAKLLDTLQHNSPAARWLLAAFFSLWAYAVADALVAADDREREKE